MPYLYKTRHADGSETFTVIELPSKNAPDQRPTGPVPSDVARLLKQYSSLLNTIPASLRNK